MVCSLPPTILDIESLRAYIVLPLYHQFLNPKNWEILQIPFGQSLLHFYSAIGKALIYYYLFEQFFIQEKSIQFIVKTLFFLLPNRTP